MTEPNPIHKRDGFRCVVTGRPADTTHHRVHQDRSNNRPSCLLAVSGSGTTAAHGWIEHNPAAAGLDSLLGWYVSTHDPRDLTAIPVWYEAGPLGQGLYLLDDDWPAPGFRAWPGSEVWGRTLLPAAIGGLDAWVTMATLEDWIRAERSRTGWQPDLIS